MVFVFAISAPPVITHAIFCADTNPQPLSMNVRAGEY